MPVRDVIPTEALLRYLQATPEQRAAIERFLRGAADGVGAPAELGTEKPEGGVLPSGAMALATAMAAPAGSAVLHCGVSTNEQGQVEVRIMLDADAPILHGGAPDGAATGGRLLTLGRLEYRPGFADVWLAEEHFDLRQWDRARHCLAYLVKMRATSAVTARHLVVDIDPYVRAQGGYPRAAAIRIDHYFNDRGGRVRRLFQELIQAAGEGRYFLRVE